MVLWLPQLGVAHLGQQDQLVGAVTIKHFECLEAAALSKVAQRLRSRTGPEVELFLLPDQQCALLQLERV